MSKFALFALLFSNCLVFQIMVTGVVRQRGIGWQYFQWWMDLWCWLGQHEIVYTPHPSRLHASYGVTIKQCLWCELHKRGELEWKTYESRSQI